MNPLITQSQLQKVTGLSSPKILEDRLRDQGIRFFYGKKGKIWTTIDLINAAGGLAKVESNDLRADDIV